MDSVPADDDGDLQPPWATALPDGPGDLTEAEIASSLPADRREEMEELADRVRRRAADAEMLAQLKAEGFAGPRWELFVNELARYGLAVIEVWLQTGYLFAKTREQHRPLNPSSHELEQLRKDPDERAGLADVVVARALRSFRDKSLSGLGWSADGGAGITTYFIGGCIIAFNNAFRSWRTSEANWESAHRVVDAELLSAVENDIEDHLRVHAFEAPENSAVVGDELRRALREITDRERLVIQLYAQGLPSRRIAELAETTVKGVEGVLDRLWKKDIRSRLDGDHHGR